MLAPPFAAEFVPNAKALEPLASDLETTGDTVSAEAPLVSAPIDRGARPPARVWNPRAVTARAVGKRAGCRIAVAASLRRHGVLARRQAVAAGGESVASHRDAGRRRRRGAQPERGAVGAVRDRIDARRRCCPSPTSGSSHWVPATLPARKAALPAYHIIRVPAPLAGMPDSPSGRATMLPPESSEIAGGTAPSAGSGRGEPTVGAPVVKTNSPLSPFGVRQVPLKLASEISTVTCTGVPLMGVTIVKPMPMLPSGFMNASPPTEARSRPAPHSSSVPSTR